MTPKHSSSGFVLISQPYPVSLELPTPSFCDICGSTLLPCSACDKRAGPVSVADVQKLRFRLYSPANGAMLDSSQALPSVIS